MFSAVVWELRGPHDADVIGDQVHGWLMNEASVNPALASRLHAPSRAKPFSIWFGTPPLRPALRTGTRLLRITSLDQELTAFLGNLDPGQVRYGRTTFDCERKWTAGTHAWAAETTAATLWHRCMLRAAPPARVSLTFLSPTAFSKGRHSTTLFPLGHLVFRSLIKSWNENAQPMIGPEMAQGLVDVVQEESHTVRTVRPLSFQTHRLKGFVGECEYSCGRDGSEQTRRVLHLLASFAFYSGVGLKRTMGMGQVVCHRVV